jgi:hypothetical protein
MEIVWDAKRRYVEVDNSKFTLKSPTLGDVKAFAWQVERAAMGFRMMEHARDAYEGGRATYENASAEVLHIIDESKALAERLIAVCRQVKEWVPDLPLERFDGKADELLDFCRQWVKVQQHTEGVRKN